MDAFDEDILSLWDCLHNNEVRYHYDWRFYR